MTIETDLFPFFGDAILKATQGSPLLVGFLFLIGIGLILWKLNISMPTSIMIIAFVLFFFRTSFGVITSGFPVFDALYWLVLVGGALIFASFILSRL